MKSVIDQLEEKVWDSCVVERPARNQETVEKWQSDAYVHLKERYYVNPLPSSLHSLIDEAITQWEKIEAKVLNGLGMTKDQFLIEFESTRQNLLKNDLSWQKSVTTSGKLVYGAVRNIDWVNLFGWILPAAYPEIADRLRIIGRMVTAIFYTELLWKNINGNEIDLKEIEACWKLANGL